MSAKRPSPPVKKRPPAPRRPAPQAVDPFLRESEQPERPHVDPEVAALLAEEEARRPPAPPRATAPPPDPEVVGHAMAVRMLQEEARERQAHLDRRRGMAPAPGVERPVQAAPRPRRMRDRTAVGREFVKPGWIPRWVRKYDDWNRPTEHSDRIESFKDYGYEVVLDNEGKEVHSHYGVLMQAAPEQYALRVRDFSHPASLNRDTVTDAARSMVEGANVREGRQLARVVGEGARPDEVGTYE